MHAGQVMVTRQLGKPLPMCQGLRELRLPPFLGDGFNPELVFGLKRVLRIQHFNEIE